MVGDAVPGHHPLSVVRVFTLWSELPLRFIPVIAIQHPLISPCCRRRRQKKERSAQQMKMTVELRYITGRRMMMTRRKRQLKRNLRWEVWRRTWAWNDFPALLRCQFWLGWLNINIIAADRSDTDWCLCHLKMAWGGLSLNYSKGGQSLMFLLVGCLQVWEVSSTEKSTRTTECERAWPERSHKQTAVVWSQYKNFRLKPRAFPIFLQTDKETWWSSQAAGFHGLHLGWRHECNGYTYAESEGRELRERGRGGSTVEGTVH